MMTAAEGNGLRRHPLRRTARGARSFRRGEELLRPPLQELPKERLVGCGIDRGWRRRRRSRLCRCSGRRRLALLIGTPGDVHLAPALHLARFGIAVARCDPWLGRGRGRRPRDRRERRGQPRQRIIGALRQFRFSGSRRRRPRLRQIPALALGRTVDAVIPVTTRSRLPVRRRETIAGGPRGVRARHQRTCEQGRRSRADERTASFHCASPPANIWGARVFADAPLIHQNYHWKLGP